MQQHWHERPTEVAEREKGLSLWRRRINPDWQNLSPMCQADPTSSKPLLGQEGVETPHFPFSFCSALQWTLSPLLLCLWLSSCGYCCWVISQESREDPTANLGASLELGSERSLQGSSTPANLGCGVPIPVLEISLLNRHDSEMTAPSVQSICLNSCFYWNSLYWRKSSSTWTLCIKLQ